MRNEKIPSEELCKALRCSASVPPIGTDIHQYCKGCPYNGMSSCCDVDKMSMDAAERIEELEKRLVKALCNMHAMAEGADHCFMCKHDNHADVDSYCQGCDGENFDWRE